MQKVQTALLAVIAAGVLALLAQGPAQPSVAEAPCVVVVVPTERPVAGGYYGGGERPVYRPEPWPGTNRGC